MKEQINKKIRAIVENGNYTSRDYYETSEMLKSRMGDSDYHYSITTADNVFNFTSKHKDFSLQLKDFDWRILWDKLGDIPINDDDEIEVDFEHFSEGTDRMEIWHWFEWFFNITLGEQIYS